MNHISSAIIRSLGALLCVAFFQIAQAQTKLPTDTTQLVTIQTADGNEFVGRIVRQDATTLVLRTETFGDLSIRKDQVKMWTPVSARQMNNGELWTEGPHSTRYFFTPNGYGLRKGEGYYSNTWIFYNQVSYGITNNFSVGLGLVPLFLFGGLPTPVWITPKVSLPVVPDRFAVGVGGLFGAVLGTDDNDGGFGLAYGVMTVGSRSRNVNIGLGYGYAGGSWANTPLVSISGVYRTGRKFALLTENFIFDAGDENYLLLSGGGRFIGRSVSIDAGLVFPTQTGGTFFAFPWLGLNVPFGRKVG